MTEEENLSVVTEDVASPPESEKEQPDQQDDQEDDSEQAQRRESDQEYNWRETRRSMDDLRRQNDELRYKVDQLSTPKSPPQDDDLANLRKDDIITVEQAQRLAEKMAKTVAEKAIREREAQTMGERLEARYPDFDDVVSQQNIEILRTQEPELFASIQGLAHDQYAQAVAAYKLIKRVGFKGDSIEMARNKAKIAENTKKPIPVQTVTKQSSAIGDVHRFDSGLTADLKKQLHREMMAASKG